MGPGVAPVNIPSHRVQDVNPGARIPVTPAIKSTISGIVGCKTGEGGPGFRFRIPAGDAEGLSHVSVVVDYSLRIQDFKAPVNPLVPVSEVPHRCETFLRIVKQSQLMFYILSHDYQPIQNILACARSYNECLSFQAAPCA